MSNLKEGEHQPFKQPQIEPKHWRLLLGVIAAEVGIAAVVTVFGVVNRGQANRSNPPAREVPQQLLDIQNRYTPWPTREHLTIDREDFHRTTLLLSDPQSLI